MTGTPASAPSAWEPFLHQGRPYLRTTLPGSAPFDGSYAVAERIAGRYEVRDLYAVGESSVLLRARDLHTGRAVLIKCLRSDVIGPLDQTLDPSDAYATDVRRERHQLQTERRLLVRLRNAGCLGVP